MLRTLKARLDALHTEMTIDSVYLTTRGYVVLGVDDVVGATQVAGGMAVMTPE